MFLRTFRHVSTVAALTACSATFAAGGALDLSSGSAGFSSTPLAGAFSDVFTFTLTGSNSFGGSIASVVNGSQDVDFTSIVINGPSGSFGFSQLGADPFEFWGLAATTLAAGNYTLTLTGMNSAAIGSYGGNVAVTAIPEPQSLAMMLGGIGCLAFLMRRRQA